jgi:hypothetical protein
MSPDYVPEAPVARECFAQLRRRGWEIGFHPSYNTLDDQALWLKEKERLEVACGMAVRGGRQHYLRFRVPDTWRIWERAGLAYDSTAGYADVEGFRCGTCRPFRPFDVEQNRILDLEERPLLAMDSTFRSYRCCSPEETVRRLGLMAGKCRLMEGEFVFLWHNVLDSWEWDPSFGIYDRIMASLPLSGES